MLAVVLEIVVLVALADDIDDAGMEEFKTDTDVVVLFDEAKVLVVELEELRLEIEETAFIFVLPELA